MSDPILEGFDLLGMDGQRLGTDDETEVGYPFVDTGKMRLFFVDDQL
ncbi:MAG: hypothetical protein RDV00_10840 [Clostridia bacterium]|nr:hypothetical protein [Clostridia bacterium]